MGGIMIFGSQTPFPFGASGNEFETEYVVPALVTACPWAYGYGALAGTPSGGVPAQQFMINTNPNATNSNSTGIATAYSPIQVSPYAYLPRGEWFVVGLTGQTVQVSPDGWQSTWRTVYPTTVGGYIFSDGINTRINSILVAAGTCPMAYRVKGT